MTDITEIKYTESQHVTLESLFQAYFDCHHNKRQTMNALAFEADYERNLVILHDEINRGVIMSGALKQLGLKIFIYQDPIER